ncbi:MAG: hypothetical protein OK442_03155 [Thaumarchaeota archaeon]|nr:hypothetical protein [Nitrososphaerota archaeon]
MRFLSRRRAGVSSIIGSIFFVLIMIVAIGSLVTIFNSFTNYNSQVNQASNSNLQAENTELSVTSGQFGAFPPSSPSNFNVATACTATSTSPTNREKTFYTANMWWDFYVCNSAFQYSSSYDGVTWSAETSIPYVITSGYTVGPYFDVEVVGTTLYLAIAKVGAPDFQLGIGTLGSGGTDSAPAGTITWTEAPSTIVAGATNALGPINMAVDSAGNQWIALVQGTCTTTNNCAIGIYEHEACATASSAGWEPNTCTSTTSPTNYAPAALGTLAVNTHTILFPAISSYSTTGVILLYEYGSATAGTIGTLGMVTQTALASTTWNTITLTGISAYSLTASSAAVVGTTFYFAGLTGTVGLTTGSLDFWSLPFTSMSAATPSAQSIIENIALGSIAWQAALTYSGATLVLFDNPPASTDTCPATDNCIQYYTTGTLGSIWSSAILLDSSETAVTGLSPASGNFAVTWVGASPFNVRFAALSTFAVTNNSPFSVHLVDLYVYNSASNALVAHYYYNSTEEFDYYVGQGSTTALPVRFTWAASTSYLVTVGTDTGVTAQLTSTSLPGSTTTCSAGQFLSQISPAETCSGVPANAAPVLSYSSSANTCSVSSATTSAGFTTPLTYTTTSGSAGDLFVGMTFNAASPATAGLTSKWQFAYGTGTAPACAATTGLGTTVGQQYTITTQAAAAGSWGQSIGVAIRGLSPSTTYWFSVQVTDSSAGTWVYSNQALSVTDVQSSTNSLPNVQETDNTNTCTHTGAATDLMVGLGVTYTTLASGIGSGNVRVTLAFDLQSPATLAVTDKWQIAYGSTATPACNAATTGTLVGKQYTVESEAAAVMSLEQSGTVVINGLSPSTTYWFDVQSTDSSVNQWIASAPTLEVTEESSTVAGIPANMVYPLSAQTAGCATTAVATSMAGLRELTTLTSSSTGTIHGTLTFNVLASGTIAAGSTSAWKLAYADVTATAMPACAAAAVGTTTNMQTYTTKTVSTTAFSEAQELQFVITGLTPGHTYWFDLQVTNAGAAFTATYSVPTLTITDIQPANSLHNNLIQLTGNAPSCTITPAASARMGGMAVIPATANPPMEYLTTSYGTGVVTLTMAIETTVAATSGATYKWQLIYGTVTDGTANPACTSAAAGTTVGNTYTFNSVAAVAGAFQETVTVTVALSHGTEYWFDFECTNSVATAANTLPQMQITEAV